jgi:hypothetical protein
MKALIELELSFRTRLALERIGIETIEQLTEVTLQDLRILLKNDTNHLGKLYSDLIEMFPEIEGKTMTPIEFIQLLDSNPAYCSCCGYSMTQEEIEEGICEACEACEACERETTQKQG